LHVVILDQWMVNVSAGRRGGASPAPCDALLLLAQSLWRKIRSMARLIDKKIKNLFLLSVLKVL